MAVESEQSQVECQPARGAELSPSESVCVWGAVRCLSVWCWPPLRSGPLLLRVLLRGVVGWRARLGVSRWGSGEALDQEHLCVIQRILVQSAPKMASGPGRGHLKVLSPVSHF